MFILKFSFTFIFLRQKPLILKVMLAHKHLAKITTDFMKQNFSLGLKNISDLFPNTPVFQVITQIFLQCLGCLNSLIFKSI